MSKFSKQFNVWHVANDKKYRTATLYRKALCKKFRNWKSPEDYFELLKQVMSLKDKNEKLKADKQLVVVPKFVADWFEANKHNLEYKVWEYIKNWDEQEENEFKMFMDFNVNNPIQTIFKMLDGYTVEKEKLFYLRNKITRAYLFEDAHDEYFEYFNVKRKEMDRRRKAKFTQSEIDGMDAGSYEQIEVKNG